MYTAFWRAQQTSACSACMQVSTHGPNPSGATHHGALQIRGNEAVLAANHPAPSTQHPHPHPHPHPHAHSIHKHTALNQSEKAEKHTDSDRERERRETRDGGRERGRRSKTQTLADVFPTVSLSVFPLSSLTHLYALGVINGFHFRLVDKRRTSIRSHRSRTTT